MVGIKTRKTQFSSSQGNGCQEEKCFVKNMNPRGTFYQWKIDLIGLAMSEKEISQLHKCTFWEKASES